MHNSYPYKQAQEQTPLSAGVHVSCRYKYHRCNRAPLSTGVHSSYCYRQAQQQTLLSTGVHSSYRASRCNRKNP